MNTFFKVVMTVLLLSVPATWLLADQYEKDYLQDGFHVLELREDPNAAALFAIERIEYKLMGSIGHLKIYVSGDMDALKAHLDDGSVQAQISTADGAADTAVTLFIECACSGSNITHGYGYTSGCSCDNYCANGTDSQEFYLSVSVLMDANTDLAIGWDPTQLWLIEENLP